MSNIGETSNKKKSNGRRKIPIETIQNATKKHVTFSKRRVGLFKKASELCALCGVEMTILTFSERGKLFCFGHPKHDIVIRRYLGANEDCGDENDSGVTVEGQNRKYEEIKRKIEDEKNKNNEEKNGLFWWDEASIDEMGLDELEQFMSCLVELRENVVKRAGELNCLETGQGQFGHCPLSMISNNNTNNSNNVTEENIVVKVSQSLKNLGFVNDQVDATNGGINFEEGKEFTQFDIGMMNNQFSMMEDHNQSFMFRGGHL